MGKKQAYNASQCEFYDHFCKTSFYDCLGVERREQQ